MSDHSSGIIPLSDHWCLVDGATAAELAQAVKIATPTLQTIFGAGRVSPRLTTAGRVLGATGERWAADQRKAFQARKAETFEAEERAKVDVVETIGAKEAAGMIRVSPQAVTAAARAGKLAGRQLESGHWLFPKTAVVDAAQARKERHAL